MLNGVVRGQRKPPRLVIYGPQGVGKSTFGADAPKPIFVTAEDGVDNVPVDQFPKAATWQAVIENVKLVADSKHEYKTLVLDTLNGIVELCSQHVCTTQYGGQWVAKKGDGGFMGWGQGWKSVSEEQRPMIMLLDQCRTRGMGVIVLAHSGTQNVRNPLSGDYTKFGPDVAPPVWARWYAWADIVGRADYDYRVVKDGSKHKAIGTNIRRVNFAGSAAEDAKCRVGYELPDTMDLSYEAFAAALGGKDSTLDEIKELWILLSADEARKALAWLGVQKLEEAPLTRARQLLNRLREKQSERAEESENKEAVA